MNRQAAAVTLIL